MEQDAVAGVELGVAHGGDEQVECFGLADVRTARRTDDETMFRIASITKTFTATALVRLAMEGRIGLDDRLREYVPEFTLSDRDAADRITIRHCLLHTG